MYRYGYMYIYPAPTNRQLLNRFSPYLAGYRYILIPSAIMTIVCAQSYTATGISGLIPLTWLKLGTTSLFLFFINYSKRRELYYYYNLGISKKKLFAIAAIADFMSYAVLMAVMVHFSPVIPLP